MGAALAEACLEVGWEVVVVSGPVEASYPAGAEVVRIVTTDELLAACRAEFPRCDGLIGAAAPCDYMPRQVADHKLAKTGEPLLLQLIETPDVVATLGAEKRPGQWLVGFALETEDRRFRAVAKAQKKSCDLMVLNGPEAMNSAENSVELLDRTGALLGAVAGSKGEVARAIVQVVRERLGS
jgi:phosphopantothenoylcysteine decarboxylase/phosphopantothenate--cysteine ligase